MLLYLPQLPHTRTHILLSQACHAATAVIASHADDPVTREYVSVPTIPNANSGVLAVNTNWLAVAPALFPDSLS
jgi:hypothetical protein